MVKVDIRGIEQVKQRLARIPRDLAPKVIQPALNKTAEKGQAEATRAITSEYAVKATDVRNSISLRKAKDGQLQAIIEVFGSPSKRGRSMNLIRFLAIAQSRGRASRVRGKKVTKNEIAAVGRQLGFLIRRAGGIKTIPGAFIGNKGRTVFIREGKSRLPIKALQVIGFSQMFSSRKIIQRVVNRINESLPVEIDRAMKRLIA
jgi:hypothetical protein